MNDKIPAHFNDSNKFDDKISIPGIGVYQLPLNSRFRISTLLIPGVTISY